MISSRYDIFACFHLNMAFNYIVTCQWGGVSNKPLGLQAATRHGPGILTYVKYLDRANLVITS